MQANGLALQSEAASVATLVDNHRRFLDFVERRVGSRAEAEELLQAAFVRGMERISALRDDESVVAWFYRLLRNAVIDHYRRRDAERRALERLAAQAEPDEAAEAADADLEEIACQCILALLPALKPEYAAIVSQVDLDGLAVHEAATRAGIAPGNARVRLHRAREALRRQIQEACGTCAVHGCRDCACNGGGATC